MSLRRWLSSKPSAPRKPRLKRRRSLNYQPSFERLEDRQLLATFVVDANQDENDQDLPDDPDGPDGKMSLREAILAANANAGADTIEFAIGSGQQTITLASDLPTITEAVVIDGATQPGYSGTPLIEVDGASTYAGFVFTGSGGLTEVVGLAINRMAGNAVTSNGRSIRLRQNFIGLNMDGKTAAGSTGFGVELNDTTNSYIGGILPTEGRNVISGNQAGGVHIRGAGSKENEITTNYIGTSADGISAVGNGGPGILVQDGANNNTVGLVTFLYDSQPNIIAGNSGFGVVLSGASTSMNRVQRNHIGTDVTGKNVLGNKQGGVLVQGTKWTTVQANLISGNQGHGVEVTESAWGSWVRDNRIGTDVMGSLPLPNAGFGVRINNASSNRIGRRGLTDDSPNFISGNAAGGVEVTGAAAQNNEIAGNNIGSNLTGSGVVANQGPGVLISNGASNNHVGVSRPQGDDVAGNLIWGNVSHGIVIQGASVQNTKIVDNAILDNAKDGILVDGAQATVVGGTGTLESNLIGGNAGQGIEITAGANGSVVQANRIGTEFDGKTARSNGGHGVLIANGSTANTIGGTVEVSPNMIAFNELAGVAVSDSGSTSNAILGNSIHDNGGLGIDLGDDGVTANDGLDADTGPNQLQNFPVLSYDPWTQLVTGTLHSAASTIYRIEVFANPEPDPSGYGEGQVFVAGLNVTTDKTGTATFSLTPPGHELGCHVTATATDPSNNTSEFANAVDTCVEPLEGRQRVGDPFGFRLPFGQATAELNLGSLLLRHALDFDRNPGTEVGRNPALVYNSGTVHVRPIIEVTYPSDPNDPVPTQILARLVWDDDEPQPWASFATTGHEPGDTYLLAVQSDQVVPDSGRYPWRVEVQVFFANAPTRNYLAAGWANVFTADNSPYGAGWGLESVDRLLIADDGVLRLYGSGDSGWYARNPDGSYTSPPGDFGTLTRQLDGSFRYRTKEQVEFRYDGEGFLTTVIDPRGLAWDYTYNLEGQLTQVTAPDGGTTMLHYSYDRLDGIQSPGERGMSFGHDGAGNLTSISDMDGSGRTLTYDDQHHVIRDQWDPLDTHFYYDEDGGWLTTIDRGAGTVHGITPAAVQGLNGTAADGDKQGLAVVSSLQSGGDYTLDDWGRLLQWQRLDDAVETWQRDGNGLVTTYTDALNRATTYAYAGPGDLVGVAYADGASETYEYDVLFHHVTSATDPLGNTALSTYSTQTGDLLTLTNAVGATTTFTWTQGRMTSKTDPLGHAWTWGYDALRLVTATDPLGNTAKTTYDKAGHVETVTDPNQQTTTYTYNPRNLLLERLTPTGDKTDWSWNAYAEQTKIVNARGYATRTDYDIRGWPVVIHQPDATQVEFVYDAAGNVRRRFDESGSVTKAVYDVMSRQTSLTDALGNTWTTEYSLTGGILATVDSRSNRWEYATDARDRRIAAEDPTGQVTTTVYDLAGQTTAFIDALGRVTSFAYDKDRRLVRVDLPDGNYTETKYNLAGNAVAAIDANRQVTTYLFDNANRPAGLIDANGQTTTMVRDPAGNVIATVDARGHAASVVYDGINRPVATVDPLGHRTSRVYDAMGNLVATIDALGRTATTVFDERDRPVVAIDPFGQRTTTIYDPTGTVTETIDARGNRTTFVLDALHRVIATVDALGNRASTVFDPAGNVQATIDPRGNVTSMVWDGLNRLQATSDALGQRATTVYDAVGNAVAQIDPRGQVTTVVYDERHRPVATIDALGNATTTIYDPAGNVVGQIDARGHGTSLIYDAVNQPIATIDALGNRATTVYDEVGNPIAQVDPLSQRTTTVFDELNRPVATIDALGNRTTTVYDAVGNVIATLDARGQATSMIHDALDRPIATIDGLGNRTTTVYDEVGNVLARVDARGHATSTVWDAVHRPIATIDALGNRSTTVYDEVGNPIAAIDALGRRSTTVYDALNRPAVWINPLGQQRSLLYDEASNPLVQIDPLGRRTTTVYDAVNQPIATIDALGQRATTVYDEVGLVLARVDPRGHRTTLVHDEVNRLAAVIDPLGHTTSTVYDEAGNAIVQVDPLGHRTTTVFDELNRPVATIDALEGRATIVYDEVGNPIVQVDPLGHRTTTVFDELNRPAALIDALGHRTTTVFDAVGNRVAAIDALSRTTSTVFDELDRPVATIDALGHRTTTVFDAVGNRVAEIDALGQVTSTVHDALDRVVAQIDPLGQRTTLVWDEAGNVIASVNPRGFVTTTVYDAGNRPIAVVDALGNRTTTVYDEAGNVLATVDARGNRVTLVHDALNRPVARTDALGHTATMVFDAAGNLVQTIDALGLATTMNYDPLGRQVSIQDPGLGITTTVYDAASNPIATIDPLGHATTTVFDELNRSVVTVDALGGRTTLIHDAVGNPTTVVDPVGNRTTFVYNARNEVVEEIDPLGKSATLVYDPSGRMTSTTDRNGRRRELVFDAAGRQTGETWKAADGTTLDLRTFTFDPNGNLLTAANGNGSYTMTYDAVDRPSTVVNPFALTLTMTFDPVGNRTLVEDSLGGVTTSTYDAANHLTRREFGGQGQTPLRIDATWTARDQLDSLTRYADLAGTQVVGTTSYAYDAAARLTDLVHRDGKGATVAGYVYTYDESHLLTSETRNGVPTSYVYDDTNQLTQDGLATYTFDPNGNRTLPGYQTGTGNQLLSDGTWTWSYDAESNTTKRSKGANAETWTYGFDNANQLTWAEQRATDGGTLIQRVEFKYDALGNRIERSVYTEATQQTAVERYALDGWKVQLDTGGLPRSHIGNENFDVWADLNDQNGLVMRRQYLDSIDSVFARVAANGAAGWYLPDTRGSIGEVTDGQGAVVNHLEYGGFGQVLSESNSSAGDRLGYTGRERDVAIGWQYHHARWYDPATGRWVVRDPLGFPAGDPNLHRYVRNNPTNATDPSGWYIFVGDWNAQTGSRAFTELATNLPKEAGSDFGVRPFLPAPRKWWQFWNTDTTPSGLGVLDFSKTSPEDLVRLINAVNEQNPGLARLLTAARDPSQHAILDFQGNQFGVRPFDAEDSVKAGLAQLSQLAAELPSDLPVKRWTMADPNLAWRSFKFVGNVGNGVGKTISQSAIELSLIVVDTIGVLVSEPLTLWEYRHPGYSQYWKDHQRARAEGWAARHWSEGVLGAATLGLYTATQAIVHAIPEALAGDDKPLAEAIGGGLVSAAGWYALLRASLQPPQSTRVVTARTNNPNLRAATPEEIALLGKDPAALNARAVPRPGDPDFVGPVAPEPLPKVGGRNITPDLEQQLADLARRNAARVPVVRTPKENLPEIEGRPDVPRTMPHQVSQETIAVMFRESGRYKRVAMGEPLSKFSGQKHVPDIEPDVMGLRHDNRIDMAEVVSPSQTPGQLRAKLDKAMGQLPPEKRGEIFVHDPNGKKP